MDAVHHLSIDIETYSDQEIGKAGLYRYAQSPAFAILLFAYSLDGGPVQVVDQMCIRDSFYTYYKPSCIRLSRPPLLEYSGSGFLLCFFKFDQFLDHGADYLFQENHVVLISDSVVTRKAANSIITSALNTTPVPLITR